MKWSVIIAFNNGEMELDRTYSSKAEAEKRAGQAGHYYKPFGAVTMVLPSTIAVRVASKEG